MPEQQTPEPAPQPAGQSLNGRTVTDADTGAQVRVESPRFLPKVRITPDLARQWGLPTRGQPK